ncbi:MAG: hypothetical protein RBR22_09700 [Desulfuromonas sp.]|nr:hypothetical protein [Desulfuromonas sp.]
MNTQRAVGLRTTAGARVNNVNLQREQWTAVLESGVRNEHRRLTPTNTVVISEPQLG